MQGNYFLILFLIGLVGYVIIYVIPLFKSAKRNPEKLNTFHFQAIPGVFTTIGILGTFIGITYSLYYFDPKNINTSIEDLLEGMKLAFVSSIAGIVCSLGASWVIRKYQHLYGSSFPVPMSEETKALNLVVSTLKDMKQEISQMRDAFIDTNTDSAKQLLDGIGTTNKELLKLGKQANADTKEMVQTLNSNHQLMEKKFTEFAELLANANTEALREAMEKLIRDFSDTFQSLIESLVNQNFAELNNSVNSLNAWQQQHREEVERLKIMLHEVISKLGGVSTQLDATYESIETRMGNTANSLERIGEKTKQLVDEDGRLAAIVMALEKVLVEESKLTQAFDKAVTAMERLQAGSEEFEATKQQITEWLNRERGINGAMTLFNEGITQLQNRLSALDAIKMEDLTLLDNSFDKRIGTALNTSFGNLDRLIKEYISFMEKNRRIEIQVIDKVNGKV